MLPVKLRRDREGCGMGVGEAGLAPRDHAPGVRRPGAALRPPLGGDRRKGAGPISSR
jgi:hypothetical protein